MYRSNEMKTLEKLVVKEMLHIKENKKNNIHTFVIYSVQLR